MMSRVVSASEARNHFGRLMRRVVAEQEPIVVEDDGKPQIVLLPVEPYERLSAGEVRPSGEWNELVDEALAEIEAALGDRPVPPAEQIIAEMREERDAQLLDLR
jgi:prevent-host-death family protein